MLMRGLRNLTAVVLACFVFQLSAGRARAEVTVVPSSYGFHVVLDTTTPNNLMVDLTAESISLIVNGDFWSIPDGPGYQSVVIIGSDYKDTLLVTGIDNGCGVTFIGGAGNDECDNDSTAMVTFFGGTGRDDMDGGPGRDTFDGGDGNDEARGRGGDDVLIGGKGSDILIGGAGDDLLMGGVPFTTVDDSLTTLPDYSVDYLTGGNGCDTFYDRFYYLSFSKSAGGFYFLKPNYFDVDVILDYDLTCDERIATQGEPLPIRIFLPAGL